jgi:glycosyltransferase involved in cell wall biosynthesis
MTSNYEGAPLTLYEAMASGLPCIVSDIPNLDIVQQSNCGIVVNFDDVETAAKKILTYMEKNISEHSDNARKFAEKELDWGIIAQRYKEMFGHKCI